MTKISIIIPVYNAENYIYRCLDSINKQSNMSFEVIIVNDGSIDNTDQVITSFIKDKDRFKYYLQENQGVSAARNYGLKKSTGDYILFIDSDDYIDENLIQDNLSIIERTHSDMIVFGFNMINETTGKIITKKPKKNYYFKSNIDFKEAFQQISEEIDMNSLWNKVYRKNFLEKYNSTFTPKKIGEDAVFNYQLYRNVQKIAFNPKNYYNYTFEREDSAMNSINRNRVKEKLEVIEEKKALFDFWGLSYDSIDNQLVSMIYREVIIIVKSSYNTKEKYEFLKDLYTRQIILEILEQISWKKISNKKNKIKYLVSYTKFYLIYFRIKKVLVINEK